MNMSYKDREKVYLKGEGGVGVFGEGEIGKMMVVDGLFG